MPTSHIRLLAANYFPLLLSTPAIDTEGALLRKPPGLMDKAGLLIRRLWARVPQGVLSFQDSTP